jgi:hypothetical protein
MGAGAEGVRLLLLPVHLAGNLGLILPVDIELQGIARFA